MGMQNTYTPCSHAKGTRGVHMGRKNMDVDELIDKLGHPLEKIIQNMRNIIKQSSNELHEGVKWNSPSYSLEGNDIITFRLHDKACISLIFHTGPKGKDTHTNAPLFSDDSNLLEWVADKRAVLKIASKEELQTAEHAIQRIVSIWIDKAKHSFQDGPT